MNFIEIKKSLDNEGQGVFSTESWPKGTVIYNLGGELYEDRSRESIEVFISVKGEKKIRHIIDPNLIYMNHSFNPNCEINKFSCDVVLIKDVEEGEELTFDYTKHEGSISNPFTDKETSKEVC